LQIPHTQHPKRHQIKAKQTQLPRSDKDGAASDRKKTISKAMANSSIGSASRLAIDAVEGVTNIVEDMHRVISRVSPIVGKAKHGKTRGITGFVYKSVRGVTRVVGVGLDAALSQLAPLLTPAINKRIGLEKREALLAALNGVLGDYLVDTGNPLAIPMRFRHNGKALTLSKDLLTTALPNANGKLLVLVHGLCMNDLQWSRDGHDHGATLARELGYTPIYLHYNSGLHISTNGRELAGLMETLVREWPVPITELVIIGHSMGGLVARSACHYAKQAKHTWPKPLRKMIFLGTPHHGAPLERAGNWVDILLGISPYSAPLARLGMIRSAGITDLRYGNLLDEDWQTPTRKSARDARTFVPLPKTVKCFAIAATKQPGPGGAGRRLTGDGLVPVASALGQHQDPALSLPIPQARQHLAYSTNHFDLLSRPEIYNQIQHWLA
jgi:pimeloyl-ACP methyl ester carboxylesterase